MAVAGNPTVIADDSDWERNPPRGYEVYESPLRDEDRLDDDMGLENGGETDRWASTLTPAELAALSDYSERAGTYNYPLRHGGQLPAGVAQITNALDRFVLPKAIVTHRISTAQLLGFGDTATIDDVEAMIGSVVVDNGFTSSTAINGTFEAYDEVVYHIKTPKGARAGAYIKGVSTHTEENEFLYNRGGCYRVLGAYTDGDGMLNVNMEWIGRKTD